MSSFLITGGSGFFGGLLKKRLLQEGHHCVSIDLQKDSDTHPSLLSIQGDIRSVKALEQICSSHQFDAVFHCAAILAHAVKDKEELWSSNVDGTRNIADLAKKFHIPKIIFTSSNCLWGSGQSRPIKEEDPPCPVEIYGKSKLEGEKILGCYKDDLHAIIIRCPTIMDEGRLGLLSILFEFIQEGRKVWTVGGGKNRYQFIYAQDLIDACIKALTHDSSETFNIGSENVPSMRETFQHVIDQSQTGARVALFPRSIAIPLMKLAYALKLSPLGPYQYKMIAEDFEFDTSKIRRLLHWRPTLTNKEMLWKAYKYYHDHRKEIEGRRDVSAHSQAAKMGVIRLLKWLS